MQAGPQLFAVLAATFVEHGDAGGGPVAQRGEQPDPQRKCQDDREQHGDDDRELADAERLSAEVDRGGEDGDQQDTSDRVDQDVENQSRSGARRRPSRVASTLCSTRHEPEPTDDAYYLLQGGFCASVRSPRRHPGGSGLRGLAPGTRDRQQAENQDHRAGRRPRIPESPQPRQGSSLADSADTGGQCEPGNPLATTAANSISASRVSGFNRSKLISAPSSRCGSNGT